MRRIIKGIAAALLLVVLMVGLPLLLIAVWPVGLPHIQPTAAGIWAALLRPDDGPSPHPDQAHRLVHLGDPGGLHGR